jgi:hypothetical protein
MLDAHAGLAATRLADGRVLISGGGFKSDGRGSPFGDWGLRKCEIFDPATNTFAQTGDLVEGRMSHTATLLRDGRVLVAGGKTLNIGGFHVYESPTDTAEIYDHGTFTLLGKTLSRRNGHTATLLPNGNVLIAGGKGATIPAEVFDAATSSFFPAPPMRVPRYGHTSTLLDDGTVLISGGNDQGGFPVTETEIYDPIVNAFRGAGALPVPRTQHAAAKLSDGRVLIVGGAGGAERDSARAFVYDPKTETFAETVSMATERLSPAATLLPNGAVLVSGGYKIEAPYAPLFADLFIREKRRAAR